MVSDCNKVDVILPNTIDDVVGKTRNDPLAEFAGHWGAYENAPDVNRLMLEFFSSWRIYSRLSCKFR